MRPSVRSASLAVFLSSALLALGCQTTGAAVSPTRPLPELPPVHAVAIYPFAFRWSEPAYRSFELSHRLLVVAQRELGDKALLFAPPDFRVDRPQDPNAWTATNLVSVLAATDVRPEHAVVVRAWAERRAASQDTELLDKPGEHASSAELVYIGHLEVLHPSTSRVILELSREVAADPFARGENDADPAPELTRVMEALSAEALVQLRGQVRGMTAARVPSVRAVFNPISVTWTYSDIGRASLQEELQNKDALEADVVRMDRIRFANPNLGDRDAARMLRLPGGLVVTEPSGDGQLAAGDTIVSVDGTPALPQTLQRARFKTTPVRMTVLRTSGAQEELELR